MKMIDEREVADRERAERLAQGWVDWLKRMHWSHFATGTFEDAVSASTATRVVRTWLSVFPECFGAVGVQRGPTSGTIHLHMVIGGVSPLAAPLLRERWVRRGHLRIERYDARREGIRYLVGQAEFIDMIGTPRWFRPRRKRR